MKALDFTGNNLTTFGQNDEMKGSEE